MAKTNKPGLLLNGRAQLEFLVRVLNPALFVMLLGGILLHFDPMRWWSLAWSDMPFGAS